MVSTEKLFMFAIPLLILGLLGVFAISVFAPTSSTTDGSVAYRGYVCTSIDRVDGTHEDLGCTHNLVTNAGLDAVMDGLTKDGTAFTYIGLCNSGALGNVTQGAGCNDPLAADTTIGNVTSNNEWLYCGLIRANGTFGVNSGASSGNWSIWNTFTSTCDGASTNMTGIFNASATNALLAENTFTAATLQTNDQLTVNWTITVTNP